MDINGTFNVLTLSFLINVLIIDPTISMGGHFVLGLMKFIGHSRVPFESHTNGKNGGRNFLLFKQVVQPPKPRASTIVVKTLHVHVALTLYIVGKGEVSTMRTAAKKIPMGCQAKKRLTVGRCPNNIRQKFLTLIISMKKAPFCTLFVINDKVQDPPYPFKSRPP
jgi:hypothetical protein